MFPLFATPLIYSALETSTVDYQVINPEVSRSDSPTRADRQEMTKSTVTGNRREVFRQDLI